MWRSQDHQWRRNNRLRNCDSIVSVERFDQAKDEFWSLLDEKTAEVPSNEVIIVAGDLNGHVGAAKDGYSCHGGDKGNVVGVLLTVYPVIEPVVVLFFVRSYREAILSYLGLLKDEPIRSNSIAKF
ncbi:unnamed protein product [Heligmosomoides polygyrus]|uniref:Craniofacial development protein 2-like n=1 Tax=Heligmosomoides polygyrus TaxID=6339 RepID=A0A183G413_HELPZ|nr:unnamed protein product [Heligmosomoides polygyrus]